MAGVIKAIEVERLSTEYSVRKLTEADIPAILNLYRGNPDYFVHCPPAASTESVCEDMTALPPGKSKGDKYFVDFFKGCELIAVMDLIAQYPDKETAFIGLLMVDEKFQHAGVGTDILSDSLRCLQDADYTRIQLGYVKSNQKARAFWFKNGFHPSGLEQRQALYTVVSMEKYLVQAVGFQTCRSYMEVKK